MSLAVALLGGGSSPAEAATPPDSASTATPVPTGPRADVALVATAAGLQRVPLDGTAPTSLWTGAVSWCAADDRAQVVWFLAARPGRDDRTLHLIDLTRLAIPAVVVAERIPAGATFGVDHGEPWGTVGREWEGVGPTTGLRLALAGRPRFVPFLDCDGDAAWYCFDSRDFGKPESRWRVNDDKKAELREMKRARLDPAARRTLAAIVARAGKRPLWPPTDRSPAPPRVEVPTDRCEEDGCGDAQRVDGTPYWTVEIGNSRGDFLHQTHALYDPRTRRFVDPRDPRVQSEQPPEGGTGIETMIVSPGGQGLLMGKDVLVFGRGSVLGDAVHLCGWVGGGRLHQLRFD